MSLSIRSNLIAANAARNLSGTYRRLADSVRRLSSGLRVDRAADDVAGLAVRELIRSEIASLGQGMRNVNDAISLVQTADGALDVMDVVLLKMRELANQAATGSYNSDQRLLISSEYNSLVSEVSRIALETEYNGYKLLASSGGEQLNIHFGSGNTAARDSYAITLQSAQASDLGVAAGDLATETSAAAAVDKLKTAIASKDTIRASFGSSQVRLESTLSSMQIRAENMLAAEARISDIDVSLEMTEFVRSQILAQSAVAMLSQANALPRMALLLISS